MIATPEPKYRRSLAAMREQYRRRKAAHASRRARLRQPDLIPRMMLLPLVTVLVLAGSATAALSTFGMPKAPMSTGLEAELRGVAAQHRLQPLQPQVLQDPEQVRLGKALFFDKILSGNKDISCAGCHAPEHALTDHIPLSIGTGGKKLGPARTLGAGREFIARHSPDLFNRGESEWTTMMWDARIRQEPDGRVRIPDVPEPIAGLDGPLAGQVLHTLLNPAEMRGTPGDVTVLNGTNELALLDDPYAIWNGVMKRVTDVPGYQRQLERAYPEVSGGQFTIQHLANAIAAFERVEFSFPHTPWDNWLAGDPYAISDQAKAGALLFYGKAQCSTCHSGTLMTDQQLHNLAVPQLLPGIGGLDRGGAAISGDPSQAFAFRTPPLRQVADTAPYMHSGAYATLEEAVRHHFDPAGMLGSYAPNKLRADVQPLVRRGEAVESALLATVDPQILNGPELTEREFRQLLAFLMALSDPKVAQLKTEVPVLPSPSALPVGYDD